MNEEPKNTELREALLDVLRNEGSTVVQAELLHNQDGVLREIQRVAAAAGLVLKFQDVTERRVVEALVQDIKEALPPELSPDEFKFITKVLEHRFKEHPERHFWLEWGDVESSLKAYPSLAWSLGQMVLTGGNPDVFKHENGHFVFGDCSPESPAKRRMLVYNKTAEDEARKKKFRIPCRGNVEDMARAMGIEVMSEQDYRHIQEFQTLDVGTWSYLRADKSTGKVPLGTRHSGKVEVGEVPPTKYDFYGGFRGILRIPEPTEPLSRPPVRDLMKRAIQTLAHRARRI